jgi:Spy/CpxP family protein refolding chaperone
MRWYMKVMILGAFGFAAVQLSTAQQPPFGVFGGQGKGPSNPAQLITNESVKKELKLTDEQVAKIPEAMMKALAEVLDADQMARFKQIELQVKGPRAFTEPAVQKGLKLTETQQDNIKTIFEVADKEIGELQKEMRKELEAGNLTALQGMRDKFNAINKDITDRVNSVLTQQQKRDWQEMIGDEFKLETPKIDTKKKKGQ